MDNNPLQYKIENPIIKSINKPQTEKGKEKASVRIFMMTSQKRYYSHQE